MEITTSIERQAIKHKHNFKGMLQGLKQFIDEEMAKGITPKHAIAIYQDKLGNYKRLFASNENHIVQVDEMVSHSLPELEKAWGSPLEESVVDKITF